MSDQVVVVEEEERVEAWREEVSVEDKCRRLIVIFTCGRVLIMVRAARVVKDQPFRWMLII